MSPHSSVVEHLAVVNNRLAQIFPSGNKMKRNQTAFVRMLAEPGLSQFDSGWGDVLSAIMLKNPSKVDFSWESYYLHCWQDLCFYQDVQ